MGNTSKFNGKIKGAAPGSRTAQVKVSRENKEKPGAAVGKNHVILNIKIMDSDLINEIKRIQAIENIKCYTKIFKFLIENYNKNIETQNILNKKRLSQ